MPPPERALTCAAKDIEDALNSEDVGGTWCLEPVVVGGRKLLFGTIRFMLRSGERGHKFIGDVSFEWATIVPGAQPTDVRLIDDLRRTTLPRGVEGLFVPFLNACPTAIAIKNADARIVFCNAVYAELAKRSVASVLNRTTQEIFDLSDAHPMLESDATVLNANQWMYTYDMVSKAGPRVSLRFPIPGVDGHPTHVGVISTTIGTDQHPLVFGKKSRAEGDVGGASRRQVPRQRSSKPRTRR
jgi:hypothetical protein